MSILSGVAYAINSDYAKELGATLNTNLIRHYSAPNDGMSGTTSTDFGFAAYVFQDISNPTVKIIAFRGTELDRLPPDPLDFTADTDIATKGVALQQIVDMYNYVTRLKTPVGNTVSQYELVDSLTPPEAGTAYATWTSPTEMGSQTHYYSIQLTGTATGLGVINPGDTVNLTGHSLGGHLELAASWLFTSNTDQVYT